MAIIDTGNGWYADEDWLRQSAGLMGTVADDSYPPGGWTDPTYTLPTDYKRVSCLKSVDGAYIDTGIAGNSATLINMWGVYENSGGEQYFLGAWESNKDLLCGKFQNRANFIMAPAVRYRNSVALNTEYHVVLTRSGAAASISVNGDSVSGSNPNPTSLSIYLLAMHNPSGVGFYGTSLYLRRAIINSFNYIAAKRESDGVYGFYETTTGVFHTPSVGHFEPPAIASSTSFYKLNSGYAVTVITKWIDWQGQTQISPVLISDSASAVDISLDGSTAVPSALGTYAIEDKVFYMREYSGGIDSGDISATGAHYVDLTVSHGNTTLDMLWEYLKNLSSLGVGQYSPVDPYTPEGTSGTGGGDGTHTIIQDNTYLPPIPSFSYANTGFFSIWIPTDDQLKALSAYMWNSDGTTVEFWKRIVSDPIDLVIGLSVVPFDITPEDNDEITIGGRGTGVMMDYTEEQYYDISCGSLNIRELWGAYLDYNPYTKVEIFLPYIGVRQLNADEIMDSEVTVTYRVDIVSGTCIAMIKVVRESKDMLLYHFSGNCGVPVPVTSLQMQGIIQKAIVAGSAGLAAVATGGTAIPVAGTIASMASLLTTKHSVQRAGDLGSAAGLLDYQKPYLVFTRPNQALPENQNTYTGYPSFITETLGNLIGYTEVEVIHLHNIPCTEAELLEIDSLLKGGVIF